MMKYFAYPCTYFTRPPYVFLALLVSALSNSAYGSVPDIPNPTSPMSGDNSLVGSSISYEWEPVSDVEFYDFRLFDRTSLTYIFRDKFVSPTSACGPTLCSYTPPSEASLPVGERHLWQIAATNSFGRSDRETTSFNIVSALSIPDTPVSVSPASGESLAVGVSTAYSWEPVLGADTYDIRLYDRNTLSYIFRDKSVTPDSACSSTLCSYEPPAEVNLSVGERHLWQIAASNSLGRSDRNTTSFNVVSALSVPVQPIAINPAAGDDLPVESRVVYEWEPVEAAEFYDFRLYDRNTLSYIYRDKFVSPELICTETLCTFSPPAEVVFSVGDRHLWQVAASNSLGRSDRSTTSFNVVTAQNIPTTPDSISPIAGEDIPVGLNTSYTWEPVAEAEFYDFRLYNRNTSTYSFRDKLVPPDSACSSTLCSYTPPDDSQLPIGERHLWQVAASNSRGRSDRSTTSFNVIDPNTNSIDLPDIEQYQLVFQDEFNGSELNEEKWDTGLLWGPYLPTNNEEQLYVDKLGMHSDFDHSPFAVFDGTLKITAIPVNSEISPPERPEENDPIWKPKPYSEYRFNGPTTDAITGEVNPGYQSDKVKYLSGIISSYGSFKLTHGYLEIRAKLPEGRGLWPAFWSLPTHYVETVPEIDIMEFLGQEQDTVYNTYHYFDIADNWRKISTPSTKVQTESNWTGDFHRYGMSWSPRKIIWYVDGVKTYEISDSEYRIPNQPMYLLANLAVGGNWPGSPDATTSFPATLEIDYIRAYKKKKDSVLNIDKDYQIMFQDEFSGSTLDPSKWKTHFLWGPYLPINNEEQYYIDSLGSDSELAYSPFSLNNGVLTITARESNDPSAVPPPLILPPIEDEIWANFPTFQRNENYSAPNFTSGIITSYESFKFSHGYAEIRAKIPSGDGLWPAFWLLNGYYVGQQPEIDVFEFRGENPQQVIHSYHRIDDQGTLNSNSFTTANLQGEQFDFSNDFHNYGVLWEPGKLTWYIDGLPVQSYESDDVGYQVMYVLANLAVGGDFNFSEVDSEAIPASLEIDYIRVYQEKDPE